MDIKTIFEKCKIEATKYALDTVGENIMIYPCGFAWVYLKVRKNDRFGKSLEAAGVMDWDNYAKHYKYWVGDFNQSVSHKEVFAGKMAGLLTKEFDVHFGYNSRWD